MIGPWSWAECTYRATRCCKTVCWFQGSFATERQSNSLTDVTTIKLWMRVVKEFKRSCVLCLLQGLQVQYKTWIFRIWVRIYSPRLRLWLHNQIFNHRYIDLGHLENFTSVSDRIYSWSALVLVTFKFSIPSGGRGHRRIVALTDISCM